MILLSTRAYIYNYVFGETSYVVRLKPILTTFALFFLFFNSFAQTVTKTYTAPSSISIDGCGTFCFTLPGVSFSTADFACGSTITDVNVQISWVKTDGSCTSPGPGNPFHEETSFRLDSPTGTDVILANANTWSGGVNLTSTIFTTFNQGSPIPSGTPVSGTFGPNGGNLNTLNGLSPFGTWNLVAGDAGGLDPLCISGYSVTISATGPSTLIAGTIGNAQTLCPSGDPDALTSTAPASGGTPALSYQWQQSVGCTGTFSNISGATGLTYDPPALSTTTCYRREVIDGCGVTAISNVITITVSDSENPVISCPANITVSNASGQCSAVVTYATPIGTDNCVGPITTQTAGLPSGSSYGVGTITNTFAVSDGSGNSVSCSFTVTVLDAEDPVITCPANIVVPNDLTTCEAVVNFTATATDNCSGSGGGCSINQNVNTDTFGGWEGGGNSFTSCSTGNINSITVYYNTAPNPNDLILRIYDGDDPNTAAVLHTQTVLGSSLTTGANVITLSSPVPILSGETNAFGFEGNNDGMAFTGEVYSGGFMLGYNEFAGLWDSWPGLYDLVFDIAISGGFSVPISYSTDPGEAFPLGSTTVTAMSVDDAGNAASCSFTVTVEDAEPPIAECQDLTLFLDPSGAVTQPTASEIDNGSSDLCGAVSLSAGSTIISPTPTFLLSLGNGDDGEGIEFNPNDGLLYHTSGIDDGTEYFETVDPVALTIGPNIAPGNTYPDPAIEEIFGIGWYAPINAFLCVDINLNFFSYTPAGVITLLGTVDDDVRGLTAVGSDLYGCSPYDGTLYQLDPSNGSTLFSVQMTESGTNIDGANGLATHPSTGEVYIIFKPISGGSIRHLGILDVLTGEITDLGSTGDRFAGLTFGSDGTLYGVTGDGGVVPSSVFSFGSVAGDYTCADTGPNTVILTVTDESGNTSTCNSTVTVVDNLSPEITCPANITQGSDDGLCGAVVTYTAPVGTDNCPSTTVLSSGLGSGGTFPVGTNAETYTVTDASGLTASCSFNVTVIDIESPTISCVLPGPNTLINPDFEDGPIGGGITDWSSFGNVFTEADAPFSGAQHAKMFGNFSGGFNVSGAFQVLPASPGETYTASAYMLNPGLDALSGGNEALVKIEFRDATTSVVGFAESPKLDASSPTDVWTLYSTSAVAPPGTVEVAYFLLFLQPAFDGGSAFLDQASLSQPGAANITVDNDSGLCSAVVTYSPPLGTDNCPGANTIQTAGIASGSLFPIGTTTNTFVVTDAAGNSAQCNFNVIVNDSENPTITCPADQTVNAGPGACAAVVSYIAPAGMDNCPGATTALTGGFSSGFPFPGGSTTVTYTVTDAATNTASCSFTVNVLDAENPTISCPSSILVNNDPGFCGAVVDYPGPTATDNCSEPLETELGLGDIAFSGYNSDGADEFSFILLKDIASGAELSFTENGWYAIGGFRPGENTITWTATSDLLAGTYVQITGLTANTGTVSGSGLALSASGDQIFAYQGTAPDAGDESNFVAAIQMNGGWDADATSTTTSALPSVFTDGVNAISIDPEFDDAAYDCGATLSGDASALRAALNNSANWLVSNDALTLGDCGFTVSASGAGILSVSLSSGLGQGALFPVGTSTENWTATDAAGNSASCSFTITVEDNEAPFVQCPDNITVSTASGTCDASVSYPEPVGVDNCSPISGDTNLSLGDIAFTGYNSDGADNFGFVLLKSILAGTELSFTENGWFAAGGFRSGENTITWTAGSDLPAGTYVEISGTSASTGSVTGSGMVLSTSGDQIFAYQGTEPVSGDESNFVAAIQMNGAWDADATSTNTSALPSIFTDGVNAIAIDPEQDNAQYDCSTISGSANTLRAALNDPANWIASNDELTLADCGFVVVISSPDVSVSLASGFGSGATFPLGTSTETWQGTDSEGNTSFCSFTITVEDNELPEITCPANILEVAAPGLCSKNVFYPQPTISDNCPVLNLSLTSGLGIGAFFPVGTTIEFWTVSDGAGNEASCSFSITITDEQDPVLTCPAAASFVCGVDPDPLYLTLSEFEAAGGVASDNCSIDGATFTLDGEAGSTGCPNILTRIYTVSDASGNSATCTQQVTETDLIPPVLTCPANISVSAALDACGAIVSYPVPAGTDNCSATTEFQLSGLGSGALFPIGTTTEEYVSFDDCFNNTFCSFTVTVTDDTGPVLTCPAPVSVSCSLDESPAFVNFGAFVLAGGTGSDNCGLLTSSFKIIGQVSSGTSCPETITRTYQIFDADGNAAICAHTIIINDETNPVLTCPADISVQADFEACGASIVYDIPIGTDNCPDVSTALIAGQASATVFPVGTTTQIYEATDGCGNTAQCSFNVTIVDDLPPELICPADVTLAGDPDGCAIPVSIPVPFVADNCALVSFSNNITGTADASASYLGGVNVVTWTAVDTYGNTSTCSITVEITESLAPYSICEVGYDVDIDANGDAVVDVALITEIPGANCDGITLTSVSQQVFSCDEIGTNIVTVEFDDGFGGTIVCTGTVDVDDNLDPVLDCPDLFYYVDDPIAGTATVTINAPSATDNCGVQGVPVNSITSTTSVELVLDEGIPVDVIWSVFDVNGNASSCTQTVTAVGSAVCLPPVNLNSNVLTPTSVMLSWDPILGAIGYQIKGRIAGSAGPFATVQTVNNFKNIGGLVPGNSYEWKVRTKCADGSISDFSPTVQFTMPLSKEIKLESRMELYPNPADQFINVLYVAARESEVRCRVLNALGAIMSETELVSVPGNNLIELDVSSLPAGIYFVEIDEGDGRLMNKFTIAR